MAQTLNVNGVEMTNVVANGVTMNRVFFNGTLVFDNTSTGPTYSPTQGLTLTNTIPEGNSDIDLNSVDTPSSFEFDISFPEGVDLQESFWYEKGGSGQGIWMGLRQNGSGDWFFRIRAGNGGSNANFAVEATPPSGTIGTDIPLSSFPASMIGTGNLDTLYVQLIPTNANGNSPGILVMTEDEIINDVSGFANTGGSRLEGGAGGSHVTGTAVNVNGEPTVAWAGESNGLGIKLYVNQLLNTTPNSGGGGGTSSNHLTFVAPDGSSDSSVACTAYDAQTAVEYYFDSPNTFTSVRNNGNTSDTNIFMYTDAALTTEAPAGFYSNGTDSMTYQNSSGPGFPIFTSKQTC